jgi:hypothetical protein
MAETVLPPKITAAGVTLAFSFVWDSATYSTGAYFGYCTIADVEFEFANLGGFTTLTDTNVATEICYAAIELQEALSMAYSMPYQGTHQGILLKLREMNAKLAYARLVNRYFTAGSSSPNHSEAAAEKAGWVNHQVEGIVGGTIRWDAPFGDATGSARLPVFNHASATSIGPDPTSGDSSAEAIFSLTAPGTRQRNGTNFM